MNLSMPQARRKSNRLNRQKRDSSPSEKALMVQRAKSRESSNFRENFVKG